MILRFNKRVLTYSGLTLNYVPQLFYYNGENFSGWTVNGGGTGFPTIDNTFGNPLPSFKITGANQSFRRSLPSGTTFHNKTITFDWYPNAGADIGFLFAQNNGGNVSNRASLRMYQIATPYKQGLGSVDNGGWLYLGDPSYHPIPEVSAIFTSANTWYNIKIRVTSNRVCTWFVNGRQQLSTYTLPAGYTTGNTSDNYFGFLGNNLGGTSYIDNLTIYSGIL